MRIDEIASGEEHRTNKQFQNLPIFGISIVFQIVKFLKFANIFKLKNFKNLIIFQISHLW